MNKKQNLDKKYGRNALKFRTFTVLVYFFSEKCYLELVCISVIFRHHNLLTLKFGRPPRETYNTYNNL